MPPWRRCFAQMGKSIWNTLRSLMMMDCLFPNQEDQNRPSSSSSVPARPSVCDAVCALCSENIQNDEILDYPLQLICRHPAHNYCLQCFAYNHRQQRHNRRENQETPCILCGDINDTVEIDASNAINNEPVRENVRNVRRENQETPCRFFDDINDTVEIDTSNAINNEPVQENVRNRQQLHEDNPDIRAPLGSIHQRRRLPNSWQFSIANMFRRIVNLFRINILLGEPEYHEL